MDSPITLLLVYLLVLVLIPVLLLLHLFDLHKQRKTPKPKLPPGPLKLPLIGNLHQLGSHLHHSLWKLSQQYGPLMYLQLGQAPAIVVSSSEIAREVMKTHDLACCNRPHLFATTKISYGCSDVVFIPYGDQWRELRRICMVELFGTKNNSYLRSLREEEVDHMISSISSSDHVPIDLSDMLLSLANNIICRAALGKSYQGGGGKYEWSKIHLMLTEVQAMLASFFMADYIPCLAWIDILTDARARLNKNFSDFDAFYQQVINDHLHQSMQSHGDQDEDIVHTLLRLKKETGHLTDENIKGVLMDIFVAGTDTSSASVEWAMSELMMNQQAMKKAQNEVRKVIGGKGKVEESDLQQLQYLKWVVKETMRLHPPAPLLLDREAIRRSMAMTSNQKQE